MPALPPDGTPRFRLSYTSLGVQHTQEYRSHLSPSAIGTLIDDLWTALGSGVFITSIDGVEFAPDGSNIFNSVTTGIEGNSYGTDLGTLDAAARFYSFIGRSSGGRRLRLFFYGAKGSGLDYRYSSGESGQIDAVVGVLVAAGGSLRCIDDVAPVWKSYANAGTSRYWQKALRP